MKKKLDVPRIVIAGLGGDTGKTFVTLGLIGALRNYKKLKVAAFKKGPDYIDAAWLGKAAAEDAHNLDSFLMSTSNIRQSFYENSVAHDFAVIEGNRGLYDGFDTEGTHSTAELAKIIDSPVILVISVKKVTRTAAAFVLGCLHLDPDLPIIGVIVNNCGTLRQSRVIADAIEQTCHIPVLGVIPRLREQQYLPDRHLGLITPSEHESMEKTIFNLAEIISEHVHVDRVIEMCVAFREKNTRQWSVPERKCSTISSSRRLRIGYFCDSAFTFYYPDNLEALQDEGAELVPISSLREPGLPDIDGLYIGGGFPETHADQLAQNQALMTEVKNSVKGGLPVYAECGGLIYLCRSLTFKGNTFPMSGIFDIDISMSEKPQGHGYSIMEVDRENPFYELKKKITGHEFHYSTMIGAQKLDEKTAFQVIRGSGVSNKRDGLTKYNVLATYLHVHARGNSDWAPSFMAAVRRIRT